ncbi:flagellar biosynthetic protein FlhB [Pseudomonas sp. JUb42]|jgi:flagellar biosynthetic protein FlhB|uniref:flagellar biosynthesis protein FlhB n=1 Tax=Pseudomonas sp. JUb42 TaxID=2940611 RepID=UPI002168D2C9|nr:flagellar biosynthesis protein FlhB [Pseudomonas sp. JUb42]MCS3470314.1 flagellar biosynthetic protein FlhB [Pseudomonas sp. JUb42]
MAENENGQDKTEDPTDKRVRDSREKGEIVRSKELSNLVLMIAGTWGLLVFGAGIAQMFMTVMRTSFTISREMIMDHTYMTRFLLAAVKEALIAMQPFMLTMVLAALIGPILLGGWMFTTSALAPNFARMNPLPGLKRMVSVNALIELLKSTAKFCIILAVAVVVLRKDQKDLMAIGYEPLEQAIIHCLQVVGWSALWMACGLIIIAAVDVPFQIYEGHKKLLMTKQEIRDEHKDSDGRPEVKQRIRQLQQELSQRRMLSSIPDADVIITNPTHFAVALKYDPEKGGAPMLLAKGTDFIALKIREIGAQHQVLILESPALARSIYYSTELDQEIPAGLYLAVAQVLAYVYQIRQFHAGRGKRPTPLGDISIPPDLQRDA